MTNDRLQRGKTIDMKRPRKGEWDPGAGGAKISARGNGYHLAGWIAPDLSHACGLHRPGYDRSLFFLMMPRPQISTLSHYTTLSLFTVSHILGAPSFSPHRSRAVIPVRPFAHSPVRPELKARRGARHADSKLVIVRGGMRSIMDIDLLDKIWSTARRCVGQSARPSAISGILSLVFIAAFNLGSAKAQRTPPPPSTPPPSTPPPTVSAQARKTLDKAQPTLGPSLKLQTSPKVTEVLNSPPLPIKDEDPQVIRLKKM